MTHPDTSQLALRLVLAYLKDDAVGFRAVLDEAGPHLGELFTAVVHQWAGEIKLRAVAGLAGPGPAITAAVGILDYDAVRAQAVAEVLDRLSPRVIGQAEKQFGPDDGA